MRIAFFGLPLAAVLLAGDGHEIAWAGICRKGALGTRRLTRLLGRDRVHVVPDADAHAATLARLDIDLIVSWFWTRNLSATVRATARHGAIGAHPSLLPRHRGSDPFFWAIDAGDRETGVSVHRLDDAYDTGAVLAQRAIAVSESDTAWSLARRLDRPSLALLREVIGRFARGDIPTDIAQDEALATAAPAPTDDDLALDPSRGTEATLRRIRAAAPWPGASLAIGDEVLIVLSAERVVDPPRALRCGEIAVDPKGRVLMATSDGAIAIARAARDDAGAHALDEASLAALVRRAAIGDAGSAS